MSSSGIPSESLQTKLFNSALKGNWEEVGRMYEEHPELHAAKITISEDTALHMAVWEGRERTVEQLVEVMKKSGINHAREALMRENEQGNTPLHLAAALGSVPMCKCIAEVGPDLIGRRNVDGETPLFVAALHGWKEAFLCLHCIFGSERDYSFCRRKDGDSFLHCAIAGEYFDLAYQIIHLYEGLVNTVNERGFSPLHILATKPSAFRSGSNITGFHRLLYNCIAVDGIGTTTSASGTRVFGSGKNDPRLLQHPQPQPQADVEDPDNRCRRKELDRDRANYVANCFQVVKFLSKAMLSVILLVFSLGSSGEIIRIKERKQKPLLQNGALMAVIKGF